MYNANEQLVRKCRDSGLFVTQSLNERNEGGKYKLDFVRCQKRGTPIGVKGNIAR